MMSTKNQQKAKETNRIIDAYKVKLTKRQQEVGNLLLQGCSNQEIADELKLTRRAIKALFNRMFTKFGIVDGVKRVKLAVILYRRSV